MYTVALPPAPASPALAPAMMIPDLLRSRPHLRAVFDRYGLRGCGGPHGPAETIAYFARLHGVDVDRLLDELKAADRAPRPVTEGTATGGWADRLYAPFFKAGIAVALTAGAVWGAILLWRIALSGSFTAISIHDVNAHGHAQIFGWVGLFVMGFAYQAFPRMRHVELWRPGLAWLTWVLMLVGLVARSIGEPLHDLPAMRFAAVGGAVAELVAIGLFALVIARTVGRSGAPRDRTDAYVFAAIGLFLVQAAGELALLLATTGAASRVALLGVIATWQAPLRDIQIHGFALLMILGVGLRMFPALFDLPAPRASLVRRGFFLLLAALAGEVGFFLLMRTTGSHAWGGPLYLSILLLAGTCTALTARWLKPLHAAPAERSRKFVQAGAAWLNISMLLLVLAPLYVFVLLPLAPWLSASGARAVSIGFSHAYYGAIRHAVTVGFISLTILGMAAKVVPTLNGVDPRRLRPLWLPFLLVNAGCALRVSLQIATDLAPLAYALVGISGVLEVLGIGLWGVHLWRIMNGWDPAALPARDAAPPARISADDYPGRIVDWYPAALPVLLAHGFTPLANPVLRRTLGRTVTLRTAAALRGIDLDELLGALNQAIREPAHGPRELPVLSA